MAKKLLVNLDLNQNELQNAVLQNLAADPTTPAPKKGQKYYNITTNKERVYNGTAWENTGGTKADLNLDKVDNTADKDKPVSTAQQAALDKKEDKTNKGAADGYAGLDSNKKLLVANIPDFVLGQMLYGGTVTGAGVATLSTNAKTKLGTALATLTLTNDTTAITGYKANEGIYYIATTDGSFASLGLSVGDWLVSTGAGWKKVDNTDAVTSVNGRIGPITLAKADVGLGNVDNTADAAKEVLSATKLKTGRKISLSGAVTGTATEFDGSKDVAIPVTEVDPTKIKKGTAPIDISGNADTVDGKHASDFATPEDVATRQPKIVSCVTATAAATAAKVVTIDDYTLVAGAILALKFTSGNTASSPTISVNGGAAIQIRTAAGQPTAASGTGAAYAAANGTMLFYYDGTYMCLFGSQDLTDENTIGTTYVAKASQYYVNPNANPGSAYYALIGLGWDRFRDFGINKITETTNSTAAGTRQFSGNPIALNSLIGFANASTTSWTPGVVFAAEIYGAYSVGTTNWKYAIGEYYNKSGVLVTNAVITDLVQTPLYIGGELCTDGESDTVYFTPQEFSLTLRNENFVYKRIGYFTTAGNYIHSDEQPVFMLDRSGIFQEHDSMCAYLADIARIAESVTWGNVSSKPNTLSGYGIKDAVSLDTAQEITGVKTIKGNLSANGQAVTPAQLGYISGLTSKAQDQFNAKVNHYQSAAVTTGTSLTIAATTHKCGKMPSVTCYLDNAIVVADVAVTAAGDVTVSWNGSAAGMIVVIMGI